MMRALFSVLTMPRGQRLRYAVAAFPPALVAIAVGCLLSVPNRGWYASLRRPSFAPAPWIAVVVWCLLCVLMASGFFRVLCRPAWMPDRPAAIRTYAVQLALGVLWAAALYGLRRPVVALAVIAALAVAVAVCARRFGQVDRVGGWSAVPYAVWVAMAFLVNLSIYIRN